MSETATCERPRVMVVDDHLSMAEMLADGLNEKGFDAVALASSGEAATRLGESSFDALVTDLRMPHVDGLELLKISRVSAPGRPVIVMTAYSALESAIESIRQGAFHYLTKPFKLDELVLFLNRALDDSRLRREAVSLRKALRNGFSVANVVGSGDGTRTICEVVDRIARTTSPALIYGETGTGKGLIARALHTRSPRAGAPFVSIDCAVLPEKLLESELFGHVKGAFSGATTTREGLFCNAQGGTLFLDEIAELAPRLQAKLLHVLERGSVRQVGTNRETPTDVRIVTATHRDLHECVVAGTFREDLLDRLAAVSIEIPPLRHRPEDIPALIEHFIERARLEHPQSAVRRFSKAALERLLDYVWPGNVRELEHLVGRMVLLGRSSEITADELPRTTGQRSAAFLAFNGEIMSIRDAQSGYAAWVLAATGGRLGLTAERLGVDIKTLARLLEAESEPEGHDS